MVLCLDHGWSAPSKSWYKVSPPAQLGSLSIDKSILPAMTDTLRANLFLLLLILILISIMAMTTEALADQNRTDEERGAGKGLPIFNVITFPNRWKKLWPETALWHSMSLFHSGFLKKKMLFHSVFFWKVSFPAGLFETNSLFKWAKKIDESWHFQLI